MAQFDELRHIAAEDDISGARLRLIVDAFTQCAASPAIHGGDSGEPREGLIVVDGDGVFRGQYISNSPAAPLPPGPDRLGLLARTILTLRMRMQGFIIFDDYGHRYAEFMQQMSQWVQDGKIKFREDIVDGLDQAPQAFIGMLKGDNFGKLVVRVASE